MAFCARFVSEQRRIQGFSLQITRWAHFGAWDTRVRSCGWLCCPGPRSPPSAAPPPLSLMMRCPLHAARTSRFFACPVIFHWVTGIANFTSVGLGYYLSPLIPLTGVLECRYSPWKELDLLEV